MYTCLNLQTYKFSTNPEASYSYVKSKQKIKTSIPHLKINDDNTTSNNLETAEIWLTLILLLLFEKLSKLKPFRFPGPDGIHPYNNP